MDRHALPPRLKKSRSGCRTCKARRVKCDEVRPVCGNCARRFIDSPRCEFGGPSPRKIQPPQAPGARGLNSVASKDWAIIRSPKLHPSAIVETSPWHVLELRLMHHYTTVVSKCMPDCWGVSAQVLWEQNVPQMAFDSGLILSPMLALSALHMHSQCSSNAPISTALTRYLDRTLVSHRQSLPHFEGELAEHVWISAIMLAHMYWLLEHRPQAGQSYELPFQAWTMSMGISLLFAQQQTHLSQLGYEWIGTDDAPRSRPTQDLPDEAQRQLQCAEEDMSHLFSAFDVDSLPQSQREIYGEAREYTRYLYQAFYSGASGRSMRRFIGTISLRCRRGYRELLEDHDPLAMAILARVMVLMKGLDYRWWMNGSGDYEVLDRDIRGITELMPKHAAWAMDWPCRVVSGQIPLSRVDYEASPVISHASLPPQARAGG